MPNYTSDETVIIKLQADTAEMEKSLKEMTAKALLLEKALKKSTFHPKRREQHEEFKRLSASIALTTASVLALKKQAAYLGVSLDTVSAKTTDAAVAVKRTTTALTGLTGGAKRASVATKALGNAYGVASTGNTIYAKSVSNVQTKLTGLTGGTKRAKAAQDAMNSAYGAKSVKSMDKATAAIERNTKAKAKNSKAGFMGTGTGNSEVGKKRRPGFIDTMRGSTGEENVGSTFGHKVATTTQYAAAGAGIYAIASAFRAGIAESFAFDDALYNNMAVLNATSAEALMLAKNTREVASTYGGTIEELDAVTLTLGRAGVAVKDLRAATRAVSQMATITGDSLTDSSKVVSTFITNFEAAGVTVEELANKLAFVANETKLSTADLGTFANYGLQTTKSLNLTINTTGALVAMMARLGYSASTIGTEMQKLDKIFNTNSNSMQDFWDIMYEGNGKDVKDTFFQRMMEGDEEALVDFSKDLKEIPFQKFLDATNGMEIRTKKMLLALRTGSDLFVEYAESIKNAADVSVQAGIAALSTTKMMERSTAVLLSNVDGLATAFADVFTGRSEAITLNEQLKGLTKGTEEWEKKNKDLKISLENIDKQFDALSLSSATFVGNFMVGLGHITDFANGVKLVVKTIELVLVQTGTSISLMFTPIVALINKALDAYDLVSAKFGGEEAGFRLENAAPKNLLNVKKIKGEIAVLTEKIAKEEGSTKAQAIADKLLNTTKQHLGMKKDAAKENAQYNKEVKKLAADEKEKEEKRLAALKDAQELINALTLKHLKITSQYAKDRLVAGKGVKSEAELEKIRHNQILETFAAEQIAVNNQDKERESKKAQYSLDTKREQESIKHSNTMFNLQTRQRVEAKKLAELNAVLSGQGPQLTGDGPSPLKALEEKRAMQLGLINLANNELEAKERLVAMQKTEIDIINEKYRLEVLLQDDMDARKRESLDLQLEQANAISDYMSGLGGVVGKVGDIGLAFASLAGIRKTSDDEQADLDEKMIERLEEFKDKPLEIEKLKQDYIKDTAKQQEKAFANEIGGYGDVAGAAASMFDEKTGAYQALSAIEEGMHAARMAMMAIELAQTLIDAAIKLPSILAETAATFGLAGANATESVTKAGTGDPYTAAARVAIMIGLMVAAMAMFGGGGGGGGGGSGMSVTEKNVQGIEDKYNPVLSKLDRQIELLEAIDRNGSASALSVARSAMTFDRDYEVFVEESLSKMFTVLNQDYGGPGSGQYIASTQASIEEELGFNLVDVNLGSWASTTVDKNSLREGYNFISLIEGFFSGLLTGSTVSGHHAGAYEAMLDMGWEQAGRTPRQQYEANINSMISDYQDLVSEFTLSLLDSMNDLADAADDFEEAFDSVTGSAYFELKRLEQAYTDIDRLRGEKSFADYLFDEVANIEAAQNFLTEEDIELLLLEDPTKLKEQIDLVKRLEEQTGITFDNGAKDALNYLESIDLVSEAMTTSRKNIKDWLDSFKTGGEIVAELAAAFGVSVATTGAELNDLFLTLQGGLGGLTDAELEFLEASKELLEVQEDLIASDIESKANSFMSFFDMISNYVDSLRANFMEQDVQSSFNIFNDSFATMMTGLEEGSVNLADLGSKAIADANNYISAMTASATSGRDILYAQASIASKFADILDTKESTIDDLIFTAIAYLGVDSPLIGWLETINTTLDALSFSDYKLELETAAAYESVTATVTPFANGGIVTGPVMGLIGEAGYNEAVIPLKNPDDPMGTQEMLVELKAMRDDISDIKALHVKLTADTSRQLDTQRAVLEESIKQGAA